MHPFKLIIAVAGLTLGVVTIVSTVSYCRTGYMVVYGDFSMVLGLVCVVLCVVFFCFDDFTNKTK